MNSKYKVLKFSSEKFENIEDLVSIEEPLEISLKFKEQEKWITQNLSITMRTPGNDEDLVRGFLFNEQIIENIKDIESIENYGDKGPYKPILPIFAFKTEHLKRGKVGATGLYAQISGQFI